MDRKENINLLLNRQMISGDPAVTTGACKQQKLVCQRGLWKQPESKFQIYSRFWQSAACAARVKIWVLNKVEHLNYQGLSIKSSATIDQ